MNEAGMPHGTATRSARSVEPQGFPADRAVLVYAVCAPELAGRRFTVEGRRVQSVRFGRLILLLSFVDERSYAQSEIDRKRDDRVWLAAEARVLEGAVERARAAGAVLPMRLLTCFPDSNALERTVYDCAARWSRSLARLGTKRECLVHLYAGPHAPPGGEPYLLRVTQQASRSLRPPALKTPGPLSEHAHDVWRDCTSLALSARRVQTARRRGALWSAALLVSEADVAALETVLQRSVTAGAALGVTVYLEAPRAPFTFV